MFLLFQVLFALHELEVEQPEPDGFRHPEQHRVRPDPGGEFQRELRHRSASFNPHHLHFFCRSVSGTCLKLLTCLTSGVLSFKMSWNEISILVE